MTPGLVGGRLPSRLPIERAAFADAMSELASGIVLVTCIVDRRPWGTTVTSFQSVSAEPPTVIVCLATENAAAEAIALDGRFGVSVLAETQVDLARYASARGRPKHLPTTFVEGALAHLDCGVVDALEIADHVVFFGRVHAASSAGTGAALIRHRRSFRGVGDHPHLVLDHDE